MNFDDLPPDIKDLIENAYYKGLIDDELTTFLINRQDLIVVPDEFPEMSGMYVCNYLHAEDRLEDFVDYLNENEILITKDDVYEELIKDFDPILYSNLRERYIQEFMEKEFERISKHLFKGE